MISNNVAFTGREDMLTKGLSNGLKKSYEYVGADKIYSKEERAAAEKVMLDAINHSSVKNKDGSFYEPLFEQGKSANDTAYIAAHEKAAEAMGTILNYFG